MRILYVASEVVPFAKTGGLADVAGALPQCLAARGHQVAVVTPLYQSIDPEAFGLTPTGLTVEVPVLDWMHQGYVVEGRLSTDVPVFFIGHDGFFGRRGLYQDDAGRDYADNAERFSFFCRAVLALVRVLDVRPDILHTNDWQTALLPAYLATTDRGDERFAQTATVLTIHNIGYQGLFPKEVMPVIGLPWDLFAASGIEFFDQVNVLKGGIVWSDVLTTVSPRYSQEIQTPQFGHRLDGVLEGRREDLFGILNGVDYAEWHPTVDPFIAAHYSREDLSGKVLCKRDLQRAVALTERAETPLLGMITRLAEQKGIDLIAAILEEVLARDAQFVILGTGEQVYHRFFEEMVGRYPGRVAARLEFDNALAHKIEAGADIFLMPSRYEPCGLNQMYSLAYGTVPVVRATGGLADTIQPWQPATKQGTGFTFSEAQPEALRAALTAALATYRDTGAWRTLQENGMAADFSWERAAAQYEGLYAVAQDRRRQRGPRR